MKHWRLWLVPLIAAVAFAGIWAADANRSLFLILNALGPMTSDGLWANITVLGDALVAFTLCLPLWRRRPDLLWAFLFVALLGTAWVHGFKPLMDLPRPPAVLGDAVHVIGPAHKAYAFPSGHATTAFAIGGLLALGLGTRRWATLILGLATLAALSRAVVGVHWPLDILGGVFGGWVCALAGLWIARRTANFGTRTPVQWALGAFLIACALWLVIGHNKSGYPQADIFQRLIGICCLAAATARLKRAAA